MQAANRAGRENEHHCANRGASTPRRQIESRIGRMLEGLEKRGRRWKSTEGEGPDAITRTLRSLHRLLAPEPWFQEQLKSALAGTGGNPGWVTLYQGQGARLGLVAVPERAPVPFHDHPDTIGVLLLLRGRLSVLTCKLSGRIDAHGALLQVVSRRWVGPGETASVTPAGGNIHRLRSLDGCSVAIDLLIEGRDSIPRNWYFPLGNPCPCEPGDRFPATILTDWRGIR